MDATGDRERFEALFDAQFVRCVRIAQRIVHDHEVAEELASEAFARAWDRWSRLRSGSPDGFVLRVTVNLAIDATRKRRLPADAAGIDDSAAEAAVLRVALVRALQALPRRQREAIALRYLGGFSEAEVSTSLGISAGSVKTHLHRGLEHLRSALAPDTDVEVQLADRA